MRYVMIDRIEEIKKSSYAIGTKCVTLSEDCFEHHYPGQPVYPGTLLLESMAQLGGALLELSMRDVTTFSPRCVLSTVKAKFRDLVKPGDTLRLKAEILSCHEDSALVKVVALRGEDRVCESEIIFVFMRIEDPKLETYRREVLDVLTRSTRFVE